MALDFPNTPSPNQIFDTGTTRYRYDGTKWTAVGQTSNVSGPLGYTGSKGYTGSASSISGPSGPSGGTGPQGPQGAIGTFGYTGSAGFTGSKGYSGSTGFTGSQGVIGYAGSEGSPGNLGDRGYTGSAGEQGLPGLQGRTGDQGISVTLVGSTSTSAGLPPMGNPGDGWIVLDSGNLWFWNTGTGLWNDIGPIVGPQGDLGYTGSRGSQGNPGLMGPVGYTGSKGSNGYDGSQGTAGATGYVGSQGDLGYTGSAGTNGSVGYTGSQGSAGSAGSQGSTGYTGSKGDQGPAGGSANTANFLFTSNQITVANDGNISLLTNGKTWTLGPDGTLTLPSSSNQLYTTTNALLKSTSSIQLSVGSSTGSNWVFGSDKSTLFPNGALMIDISALGAGRSTFFGDPNGLALGTGFGYDFAVNSIDGAHIFSNNYEWHFKTDGVLTVPGNILSSAINTATTNGITIATGVDTNFVYIPGTTATEPVGQGNTSTVIVSGKNGVTINAGADAFANEPGIDWTFSNTGTLTLPNGTAIGSFDSPNGIELKAFAQHDYVELSYNSDQYLWADASGAYIATNYTATGHIWTFAKDGVMSAPGHLIPNADLTHDLGSPTAQWRSIYVGTGTVYIGGVALGVNENNYVTVDGNPIITVNTTGNLTIQGDTNIVLGAVVISDTAPAATTPGSQWYNSVDGRTYVAYNETWVDSSPTVVPTPETYLGNIAIDGDTLNINGGTLTIDDSGKLLVNGSRVVPDVYGASLTASATDPMTSTGTLWFNTVEGRTYLKYNDQWVDVNPTVVPLPSTYLDEITIDGSTINMNGSTLAINTAGVLLVNGSEVTGSGGGDRLTTGSYSVILGSNGMVTFPEIDGTKTLWGAVDEDFSIRTTRTDPGSDADIDIYAADDLRLYAEGDELQLYANRNVLIYTDTTNTSHQWTFGQDAVLTLPNGMTIDSYGTLGANATIDIGGDNTRIRIDNNGAPPGLYITTDAAGANYGWQFGPDGILTLSTASTILGNSNDPNVYIETSTTATTSTWTFGTDGVLTLPADTPIIKGSGTGTDVTIIASTGSNTSTWTFTGGGGLTFPDTTVQTTAWNDQAFHNAMETYDGEIITNTATIGVGGLVVNGPVTFNGPFTFQSTATTQVTGNTGTFYGDVNGVGALYAGVAGYSPLPSTVFQSAANVNAYIQNNFQNLSNGTQASAEWVATANNGDDSNHYLDMGIAGSGWDGSQSNSVGSAASANDSWVYAQGSTSTSAGGNLILGTIKNGKSVKILTGSTGSSSIVATFNGRNVDATSTNTGALQVVGGAGISGGVYAGTITSNDGYFRGPSGYGNIQLTSGGTVYIAELAVNSTGLIKGPGGSTHIGLLSGTGGSVRFYNTATISGTTAATSTTNGALTVAGGVGIQGALYVGSSVSVGSSLTVSSQASITGNILGYGSIVRAGNRSLAAWGGNGAGIISQNATYTDTSSAGTLATSTINYIGQPTLAFSNTTTVTQANTLYISSAPVAGTNATITTGYALNVASGSSYFGGNIVANTYVTQAAKPAFRVYGTISADVTATTTISATHGVALDYNQGSYYSTSTGVFTAPVAGLYHCFATVRVGSNNGLNQAGILKNNTTTASNVIAFWETDTNVGTAVHFSMNGYARLAVGDTVRLNVISGKVQFDANDSWGVTFIG